MALLLVYGRNNSHADSVKDRRGCYKLGDIVQVLDEDAHDGDIVANPIAAPMLLIRVSGISSGRIRHVMRPEYAAITEDPFSLVLTRRVFGFDLAALPQAARDLLQTDRYAEITRLQAKAYLRHKITNVDMEGET